MIKLGEQQAYLKSVHLADYERTVGSYRYIIARRDNLADRIRFGLIALNGASIVALISSLSGQGTAAQWIGIDKHHAPIMGALFVAGLITAGWAALRQQ